MTGRDAAIAGLPAAQVRLLDLYVERLCRAQQTINLVGSSTLPELWTRHIADSLQLARFALPDATWLDMGAGGGLPGIVLAILGKRVHLVEATAKKARFLAETTVALGLADATVHAVRVEAMAPFPVDIITARALKPLTQLFAWGLPFSTGATRWVLPKGARAEAECDDARRSFAFVCDLVPSRTAADSRIVVATRVERR